MKVDSLSSFLPQMNTESSKRDQALEKIIAAQQLNSTDAVSIAIADILQSDISVVSQGLSNATDGISMMQIAGGTLSSLSDQTQTLNDLSVRYNSAALNHSQKQALESEFSRTVASMQQSIDNASFNGKTLFGSNTTFSLGTSTISSSIPTLSPTSLTIDNQDAIQAYRASLTQAGSDIGATSNGLVSASNTILDQINAASAAKSQIIDTDIAKVISDFQHSNLKLDIAQITMAHQTDMLQQNITRLLG